MGGGGNEVGVREGARVQVRGHQSGDVRHIHHQQRPTSAGDGGKALEVERARVGAGPGDHQFRLVLGSQALELVVVDGLRVLAHAVRDDLIHLAREVQRVAVGQVASVRQVHAQHSVARFEHGHVDRLVGLGARVGLDVRVFGVEELLRALDGK